MRKLSLKSEEKYIGEALVAARTVQEFLWGHANHQWSFEEWKRMFRKRVEKLDEVSRANPHAAVEVRKRLLQTAAISIALLKIVDQQGVPWEAKGNLPSSLPKYAEEVKQAKERPAKVRRAGSLPLLNNPTRKPANN